MNMYESLALAALALALAAGASAADERAAARREPTSSRLRTERPRAQDSETQQPGATNEPGATNQPGDVSGRVLNPDGTAAAGVSLTAVVLLAAEEHSVPTVLTTTSDATGAFILPDALPTDESWDLTVIAQSPGFALETLSRTGTGGDGAETLRMALEPAQEVKLRFVNVGRTPVEGVLAFTMRRVSADGHDNYLPLAGATRAMKVSGGDGIVLLDDFSPGDRVTIGIKPPGKPWEMRSFVADVSTELILAPAPNGGVAGSVRDDSGAPIAGANIMLISTTWTGSTTTARPFATRSLADGNYTTRNICPLGERYGLLVSAAASGFAFESKETLEELGNATRATDFKLERAETVRVRVLDANGKPLVGARVCPASRLTTEAATHVVPVKAAGRVTRVTDDKGMVTLDCFARGDKAVVQVTQQGNKSTLVPFDVAGSGDIAIQVKP